MLGIDVLESMNFAPIAGKRVGLLTHPAGVNMNGESTIDVLRRARNIRLKALYGPEHWECRVAREHMELARRAAETAQQRKGG